jgi:hypothetical protein
MASSIFAARTSITAWADFRGAFYFRAAGQSIDDGDLANIVVFFFL